MLVGGRMKIDLTPEQKELLLAFEAFADKEIAPNAGQFDREERLPAELIAKMAQAGFLGAVIPKEYGGAGFDMISFGLLNEAIGKRCSSARTLLTVQSMLAYAILKWGSKEQRSYWLPRLATGEIIGAFGLSEPNIGSDAKSMETSAIPQAGQFVLNGQKKWITFGQIANLFIIFARSGENITAFLVERNTAGFSTDPISGMLGTRASMLAGIQLQNCLVPEAAVLGKMGFGWSLIAATALDIGRYSVAWGCVGIAQACLEASLEYSNKRLQFGTNLKNHQLIQRMLAGMVSNTNAARSLCLQAGHLRDRGDPNMVMETCIAKYFASTICVEAANDAVQIHGANGCSSDYPVQRYYRDAKVMEIIEGSREIQQMIIAKQALQEYALVEKKD
jgi:glutaryl-CoA dehydrogenase (non-decarboxylating)